jgi:hypothetical protein
LVLVSSSSALDTRTWAFPSNGRLYVVVNNQKANGATTGSGGCREFCKAVRRWIVDLWESAWPAAELGQCSWPTRVERAFEDEMMIQ